MNANNITAEIGRTKGFTPSADGREIPDGWQSVVRQLVSTLRFGVVQITVHESHVVQVERPGKVHFAQPASRKPIR
jgi:hypothetical protein